MTGISRNNPFPRDKCTRTDCLYLEGNCKEHCYREGIIYEATCLRCKELDQEEGMPTLPDQIYIGETSRTLMTRYRNHLRDYKKAPQTLNQEPDLEGSSWMMDHSIQKHGGPGNYLTDFSFKPVSEHRDPLTRQIEESVRIAWAVERGVHYTGQGNEIKVKCLNRKGEAFAPIQRWEERNK